MAEPFGDQDRNEGLGKRPAPTIEGTATEVSVEPASGDASPPTESLSADSPTESGSVESGDTEPVIGDVESSDAGETPAVEEPQDIIAPEAKPKSKGPPPRTSAFELKSFLTHLAAGLLGGLIGVLALALVWNKLPIQQGQSPDLSALQARLAKLEAAPPAEPAPVDTQALAALDTRLKNLEDRKPEAPADLSGLTSRVTKLEDTLDALAKSAGSGGSVANAAALETKLGDLEKRLQAKIDAALSADKSASTEGIAAMQGEIAALKAKLGALAEAGLNSAEASSGQDVAALDKRIAKLEAALPDLAAAVNQNTASAKSGAVAIAFANLRQAVDAGQPYAAELSALRALDAKAKLGQLPAHAETGIPTVAQLSATFAQAAETSSAAAAPAESQSFLDSVIASAKSTVQIRRVDAGEAGTRADSAPAYADADLKKGDLAAAVKEVEALPAPQREASAAWLANAKARIDADATLSALEGTLLASMGGAKSEAKP
jgi:hypothetical protein